LNADRQISEGVSEESDAVLRSAKVVWTDMQDASRIK